MRDLVPATRRLLTNYGDRAVSLGAVKDRFAPLPDFQCAIGVCRLWVETSHAPTGLLMSPSRKAEEFASDKLGPQL
ncbi:MULTISPECIES: hypothetical protein [unclassified Ensifer]|uniref:hypothetical protein n=1 Tax=unclassified Ensifer TaxID=2633371 RepID=UPI0011124E5F|nr:MULTISPECIES: hypothetical protein [unclassified Ensifer]